MWCLVIIKQAVKHVKITTVHNFEVETTTRTNYSFNPLQQCLIFNYSQTLIRFIAEEEKNLTGQLLYDSKPHHKRRNNI